MGDTPVGRLFLAECFWPDVREAEVEAAAARLSAATPGPHGATGRLAYTGSLLVRQDEVVFFLFRATSGDLVRDVCMRANVPLERVVEVMSTLVGMEEQVG